jgi:uncharacterized protein (TIRG00374 family)
LTRPAESSFSTPRLRTIVGFVIGAAALWMAFAQVELGTLARTLRSGDARWLIAAFLSVFVTVALVVTRLRILMASWAAPLPWTMLWHVTIVGQVANLVVPLRLGDGVKVVAGSRALGVPAGAFGSAVAMERLFDIMSLVMASVVLLIAGDTPGWTRPILLAAVATGASISAAGIAAVQLLSRRRSDQAPAQTRFRAFVTRQANLLADGFARMRNKETIVRLLAASAAITFASAGTNLLVMRAFDLPVPAAAALLLLVIVQSGNAVAAAPAGIGVSQFLAIQTLGLWNVAPAEALACSLVLFVVARAPKLVMLPLAMAAMSAARPAPHAPTL